MAILRGFPPSSSHSCGTRFPVECEDCHVESYDTHGRNPSGAHEPPSIPQRWVYLCNKCADKRLKRQWSEGTINWKEGF